MGAWGVNSFDNDTACDWAYDLDEKTDLSLVEQTFDQVLAVGDGYLDAGVACEALAACEVVARLRGNWGVRDAYTENVDKWVLAHATQVTAELTGLTTSVIDRILAPSSELLELWDDSDSEEWRAAVADLRARVTA